MVIILQLGTILPLESDVITQTGFRERRHKRRSRSEAGAEASPTLAALCPVPPLPLPSILGIHNSLARFFAFPQLDLRTTLLFPRTEEEWAVWACLFVCLRAVHWCCWWLLCARQPRESIQPMYTKVSQGDIAKVRDHFGLC